MHARTLLGIVGLGEATRRMDSYEEAFVTFVDFLGFSEASRELDDTARLKVLELLQAIVALRSEFSAAIAADEDGSTRAAIKPAVSTFSDHIVISYSLETLQQKFVAASKGEKPQGNTLPLFLPHQLQVLISRIAAAALTLGFLIRGAATIGKLYRVSCLERPLWRPSD